MASIHRNRYTTAVTRRFSLALFFLFWPSAGYSSDRKPLREILLAELKASPQSQEAKLLLPILEISKTEEDLRRRLPELSAAARGLPATVLARTAQNAVAALNNEAARWQESKDLADKVLFSDPQNRTALLNRSGANYGLKDFNSAFLDADTAARLDAYDPQAYVARALAAYGMKDYPQTLEDARRAIALDPSDKTAASLLKLTEGRKPPRPQNDREGRVGTKLEREYRDLAQQLNQAEEKRKSLAAELMSPEAGRLIRSAASKLALRDYAAALEDAEAATRAAPESATAFYYKATALNLLSRYEEAVASASRALALNPNDVAARDARAWARNHLDEFHKSIADSNHSLELDASNAYAYANRGFANEKLGNIDAMAADLKRAAELSTQFEPVYHDAMAMHNLPTPAFKPREFREPLLAATFLKGKGRFLLALIGSLAGGFLTALGLLHLLNKHKSKSEAEKEARNASWAKARVPSGIDSSYAIGRPIGRGGMGLVFEAVDRALQRKVAVKILREEFQLDAKAKQRFLEEARTVAALHHPGIVDIHSIVEDEAGLYMIFEYIEGRTLDELLEKKRFGLAEAKNVMRRVCQALEFAHRHNVVHRDLKPANIMIANDGTVKVMDFGISRHARDAVEAQGVEKKYNVTNSIVGTPYYMSPEQEYGIVRPESDIFSLGACLYEMLSGRHPFPAPASSQLKLARDYAKLSSLVAGLPKDIDAFIDAALEPDPDKRISSAADFWSMLDVI